MRRRGYLHWWCCTWTCSALTDTTCSVHHKNDWIHSLTESVGQTTCAHKNNNDLMNLFQQPFRSTAICVSSSNKLWFGPFPLSSLFNILAGGVRPVAILIWSEKLRWSNFALKIIFKNLNNKISSSESFWAPIVCYGAINSIRWKCWCYASG